MGNDYVPDCGQTKLNKIFICQNTNKIEKYV